MNIAIDFEAGTTTTVQDSTLEQDTLYCQAKLAELKTKSAVIRYLTAEGWKRGRISKGMNILYQHVRNEQLRQAKKTEAK